MVPKDSDISVHMDDDVIQPFQLESSFLRGRVVRMGDAIDQVLSAHDYPNPVAHLVAETMSLTLLLSSMLKYDGVFTLQAQGDGPVSMLVADVTSGGIVRACASFDEERLEQARVQLSALKAEESAQNHLAQYLGKGHIAFTVDQAGHERYQGIVELKGASLIDCVRHYFNQSEQMGMGIKMAVGQRDGRWRTGGIMIQHMMEDNQNAQAGVGNLGEDDWRRAMVFLDTCTEDELLDVEINPNALLTRLFHEEGVRVFDPISLQKGCRCDEGRVKNVLYTMPAEDLEYMAKKNKISMRCEFCSTDYEFELQGILQDIKKTD